MYIHRYGSAKGFQWPDESGINKHKCKITLENVLLKENPMQIGLSSFIIKRWNLLKQFAKLFSMVILQIYITATKWSFNSLFAI